MRNNRRDARIRGYVLLDRDGTVIVDKNYQRDPDQTELLPGALAGLQKLAAAGFRLAIVTNQSGIGRGLLTEDDLSAIHRRLAELLGEGGVELAGIYHCPHLPSDRCDCRKPGTGMVLRAAGELGFDPKECFVVGDREGDIEMGRAAGGKSVLVRTGGGAVAERSGACFPDFVADDLPRAADWIIDAAESRLDGRGGIGNDLDGAHAMNGEKDDGRDESELRRTLAEHARGKPFRLNPDSGAVDRIVSALAMRRRKTGFAYCPCRVVTGNPEKDKDIVCPCAYHEEEVARQGHCHCQLFVSPEFSSAGEGSSGVRGL